MIEWVCPECGLDYGTLTADALPLRAEPLPGRWRGTLGGLDDVRLRRRPTPTTWSPIEYAAHTRDVVADLRATLLAMLGRGPMPSPGDPDEVVLERRYAEADLAEVLDSLEAETDALVAFLRGVTAEEAVVEHEFEWGRRDLLTIAGNAVHEHTHHLFDVERILAGSGGAGIGDGPTPA
ncbi:MAG: DinB family protein [Acidimicrobiia bacterium]